MKKSFLIFLFITVITHAQWMQVNNGMGNLTVTTFTYVGNFLFAGTYGSGVYFSSNNGTNWTQSSLNNCEVNTLTINGNNIFAGTEFNGIYRSTNNGANWTQVLNRPTIRSLAVSGINILAGTSDSGIYISTNNGTNWILSSLNNRSVYSLMVNGNYVFAGCDISGVYLSSNNGANWSQTTLNNRDVRSLAVSGNNISAGTFGQGIFISTDNGTSWPIVSLNSETVLSLAVDGINVFAGTISFGVYVSNNNGANWVQRNEGLPYAIVEALFIYNNNIFAGRYNGGVYRRPLGELIGIQPVSNEIPGQYSLSQNYPNPFNPVTNIEFAVSKSSFVKLLIYDLLGRVVETLVNKQIAQGIYKVDWNASNYPSGVYFYRLEIGDFADTRKMMLIK